MLSTMPDALMRLPPNRRAILSSSSRSLAQKKDRRNGRSGRDNNVEKQRTGTEAENVSTGFPLFNKNIAGQGSAPMMFFTLLQLVYSYPHSETILSVEAYMSHHERLHIVQICHR